MRTQDFARIEQDAQRMEELAKLMADEGAKNQSSDLLVSMSQTLAGDAADIADAAKKRSLQDIAHALGEASGHCADCHQETRWKPH